RATLSLVHTTEIDGKLSIHEDPDVVVASEVQLLTAQVFEVVANFAGEMKVSTVAFVTKTEPIDRPKTAVVELVGRARSHLVQPHHLIETDVDVFDVSVPLIVAGGVRDGTSASAGVAGRE